MRINGGRMWKFSYFLRVGVPPPQRSVVIIFFFHHKGNISSFSFLGTLKILKHILSSFMGQ